MSDTRRYAHPNWKPGLPDFDSWNESNRVLYIPGITPRPIKSLKDQTKDRRGRGKEGGKFGRFVKGCRNSRWNLLRKNEKLEEREQHSLLDVK